VPSSFPRFQPASFLRLWTHKQSTLGIPLLDRAKAGEVLDAILAWRKKAHPKIVGATFPLIPLEGETFELLKTHVGAQGLCIRILDHHRRAVLHHKDNPDHFLVQSVFPQRRKQLSRLRRRLDTRGELLVRMSLDLSDILVASNHFLELEAKGWKGKRGTALAVAPRHAAFARELIANLSSEMPHHQHGCEWRVDCDWAYIDKRRSGVLLEDRL
jgi:hypothetical protein